MYIHDFQYMVSCCVTEKYLTGTVLCIFWQVPGEEEGKEDEGVIYKIEIPANRYT